jgi:DNA-directed RNA polymerase subunit RPC12/RpoP
MTHHHYKETTKEDWLKTMMYIAVFVLVIISGAIILLPSYAYIWLLLFAGSLFLLVKWHAHTFGYRCPNCGHEFAISTVTDFVSPHGLSKRGGWKYLKCPQCHERIRAMVIKKNNK